MKNPIIIALLLVFAVFSTPLLSSGQSRNVGVPSPVDPCCLHIPDVQHGSATFVRVHPDFHSPPVDCGRVEQSNHKILGGAQRRANTCCCDVVVNIAMCENNRITGYIRVQVLPDANAVCSN